MIQLEALKIYPVKGCAGIALQHAKCLVSGLEHDREWMIVDRFGQMVTQRDHPMIARIQTHLDPDHLTLSLYGAGSLSVALRPAWARQRQQRSVQIWAFRTQAHDCGEEAAHWLSEILGFEAALVQWSAQQSRWCETIAQRLPGIASRTMFADGHPVLVINQASVQALSHSLGAQVPEDRFRANLVISGLPAYDEDILDRLSAPTTGSEPGVRLMAVKPCTRCSVPGVDQVTGAPSMIDPLPVLIRNRFDQRWEGATFGMNLAIEQEGMLRVGDRLTPTFTV
jgi:hypothetical protein